MEEQQDACVPLPGTVPSVTGVGMATAAFTGL